MHRIHHRHVSCFLLYVPGNAILVDCGRQGSEKRILAELQALGLAPGMLRLLVLTHAHYDHAGSAGRLSDLTGCRIMIHESEAGRLREGFTELPSGTRWKARLLVGLGRIIARRLGSYPPAGPDLLAGESEDLRPFGFPGKVLHTPGHTVGSMVVLMEDGELIAGDTFFGLKGKQHFPPFAEDLPSLVRSWRSIREMPVKMIHPAHGGTIASKSFFAEFEGAMERYG